jgi:hypothetical protein
VSTCGKTVEITAYLKGETPEGEREALRLHFEQCAICAQEIGKFDRALKALGKLEGVDPSPGFKWRVREAFLRAHPEFLERPAPERLSLWQQLRQTLSYVPAWAMSVAAHVILIAIAALLFFTPRSEEDKLEEQVVRAKPRPAPGPGPVFKEGPSSGKPAPNPSPLGNIPPDPLDPTFTRGSERATDVIQVKPKPRTGPGEVKLFDVKANWTVRLDKDRRLLGFFEDRGSRSQREQRRIVYGGKGTEEPIRNALDWLARHQKPNGSWTGPALKDERGQDSSYTVGLTGLALLAYLSEGYGPKSGGDYAREIQRGLDFLMAEARSSGRVGPEQGNYMYNHAIGALSLLEASLLTRDPALRHAASSAVSYTIQSQNETGGWGYTYRSSDNDTSVAGWQIQLLRLAFVGGNQGVIPALNQAYARLQEMTDSEGKVGYKYRLHFPNGYQGLTAVGMLSHQLATHTPDADLLAKQAGVLLESSPILGLEPAFFMANDLYFAYFGSLAMHQLGGDAWTKWWSPLRDKLLRTQSPDGSWPANFDRWHAYGGQVYSTALSALILETPVRYPRLWE